MAAYWISFKSGAPGCVEADTEDAALVAAKLETGRDPASCSRLPYPADPRLVVKKFEWNGKEMVSPSFCFQPEKCKGKTSCPRNYSCVE